MQDGAVFREVDFLATEHGGDPPAQTGFLGQLDQQFEGLVGDAVLRIIQVEARRLDRQTLAAFRVIGEQFAQMQPFHLLVVGGEGLPCRPLGEWFDDCLMLMMFSVDSCQVRRPFERALLDAITAINSFQDFTNDFAPSS